MILKNIDSCEWFAYAAGDECLVGERRCDTPRFLYGLSVAGS